MPDISDANALIAGHHVAEELAKKIAESGSGNQKDTSVILAQQEARQKLGL